ncbi:hypothetical protein PQX77_012109 [Marasmius sp. AFHP31]|nr:hypothetical protein PQX77_012109 [Marasmius sp. AFHP31]
MVVRFTPKSIFDISQGFANQPFLQLCIVVPSFLILQVVVKTLSTVRLIPGFIATAFLCDVVPFSARDLTHSASLADASTALFGAPVAPPTSVGSFLSRIIQATVLFHFLQPSTPRSSPKRTICCLYLAWIPVGLLRTLIGFIFTRSVGWAYPSLFRHWALYEMSEGLGAGLVVCVFLRILSSPSEATPTKSVLDGFKSTFHVLLHLHENHPIDKSLSALSLLTMTLAVLEEEPWTYACALLIAGLLRLLAVFRSPNDQERLPSPLNRPTLTLSSFLRGTFIPTLCYTFLPLLGIYILTSFWGSLPLPTENTALPPSPSRVSNEQRNLLEVVMLSYPRPGNVSLAEEIITTSINSYKPLLDPGYAEGTIVLSVFTHASSHLAFQRAREKETDPHIQFYIDQDYHSIDDYDLGQYLHLAEAFKWIAAGRREGSWKHAEWIMIVEDDFPLCQNGADILKRTMWLLELGKKQALKASSEAEVGTRSAFIGTGGSGLIFHHTLLPMLEHILRTHALPFRPGKTPFPPFAIRRPADVVMQDCLLGLDPLCSRELYPLRILQTNTLPDSVKEDLENINRQSDGDVTMFIPSKLVMDHIGGMVSTTFGKKGNTDKWRCGWRHAFHGKRDVGVLVVKG